MKGQIYLVPADRIPVNEKYEVTGMTPQQIKAHIESVDLVGEYAVVQVLRVFAAEEVRTRVAREVE